MTCFQDNHTSSGAAPSSSPAAAQTLYPCSRPTVGIPNPVVDADLLLAALQTFLCRDEAS